MYHVVLLGRDPGSSVWVHLSHTQGVLIGLFPFLSHSLFSLLFIFLFCCVTAVFHLAVKMSMLLSEVNTFEWRGLLVFEV